MKFISKTTLCVTVVMWNIQSKQIPREKKQMSGCQGLGFGRLFNGNVVSLLGDGNGLELKLMPLYCAV